MQRAANGCSAHAETFGDDPFGEGRSRRQLTPDDELAELLKRVVAAVALDAPGS